MASPIKPPEYTYKVAVAGNKQVQKECQYYNGKEIDPDAGNFVEFFPNMANMITLYDENIGPISGTGLLRPNVGDGRVNSIMSKMSESMNKLMNDKFDSRNLVPITPPKSVSKKSPGSKSKGKSNVHNAPKPVCGNLYSQFTNCKRVLNLDPTKINDVDCALNDKLNYSVSSNCYFDDKTFRILPWVKHPNVDPDTEGSASSSHQQYHHDNTRYSLVCLCCGLPLHKDYFNLTRIKVNTANRGNITSRISGTECDHIVPFLMMYFGLNKNTFQWNNISCYQGSDNIDDSGWQNTDCQKHIRDNRDGSNLRGGKKKQIGGGERELCAYGIGTNFIPEHSQCNGIKLDKSPSKIWETSNGKFELGNINPLWYGSGGETGGTGVNAIILPNKLPGEKAKIWCIRHKWHPKKYSRELQTRYFSMMEYLTNFNMEFYKNIIDIIQIAAQNAQVVVVNNRQLFEFKNMTEEQTLAFIESIQTLTNDQTRGAIEGVAKDVLDEVEQSRIISNQTKKYIQERDDILTEFANQIDDYQKNKKGYDTATKNITRGKQTETNYLKHIKNMLGFLEIIHIKNKEIPILLNEMDSKKKPDGTPLFNPKYIKHYRDLVMFIDTEVGSVDLDKLKVALPLLKHSPKQAEPGYQEKLALKTTDEYIKLGLISPKSSGRELSIKAVPLLRRFERARSEEREEIRANKSARTLRDSIPERTKLSVREVHIDLNKQQLAQEAETQKIKDERLAQEAEAQKIKNINTIVKEQIHIFLNIPDSKLYMKFFIKKLVEIINSISLDKPNFYSTAFIDIINHLNMNEWMYMNDKGNIDNIKTLLSKLLEFLYSKKPNKIAAYTLNKIFEDNKTEFQSYITLRNKELEEQEDQEVRNSGTKRPRSQRLSINPDDGDSKKVRFKLRGLSHDGGKKIKTRKYKNKAKNATRKQKCKHLIKKYPRQTKYNKKKSKKHRKTRRNNH